MAERRPPGFNIPLGFYDGPEVQSIPRRIRAAAIGVWGLAGNYAATQLTDGYVGPELLKMFGCTPAIRSALKVTINKKGELSPLWEDAHSGGVQLTNWPKHQRTNDEVTTYRANEAERKRTARAAKRGRGANSHDGTNAYLSNSHDGTNAYLSNSHDGTNAYLDGTYAEDTPHLANDNDEDNRWRQASTSGNGETSGRTTAGRPHSVRPDHRDPKTETETETESFPLVTSGGGVASVDAHDPRPHCPDHKENYDGPCRKCRRRREWDERHAAQIAADELEHKRRIREIAASCPTCHGTNWIPDTEPAVKCNHQEAQHA
ncbi:hypothetical protein [Mycolicibacterium brisbanense]|uniref:Uncharacterized protein n=1 Tax=Mycolicibacterium brisbanense TaxID=146020 RepID=A0A100W6T9_9MYCO|nr:hypothetical protein [Mycolicibacterium brisbanense]MCV7158018.1 hypothetical protein [Mycolicibacterium brisbanense]GAS92667.1 uncharacterized protein RMCB_6763 [Mycolicibacterium brisbanense]